MTSVFRGVEAASESEFGVAGAIVSGSCIFLCVSQGTIRARSIEIKPYYL